ncbi:hypothetical protein [Desulfoferrobacter suflitae]|uniref:hypothetical protein n=1 Tax=Desulfoferrobacter suflitae TaxID=2865782 RepID=UPI00216454C8|nr:hypothetical protein [Desulfoferrobacter suflitae]MCK8603563.1 hypothetical protein [Desulfoferrobacter suflitae]
MKKSRVFWGWLAVAMILNCTARHAMGETFNVSTVQQLRTALNEAAANDEDDLINISTGTYHVDVTLTYHSGGVHSLTIVGAGIGSTRLDGGSARQILTLATSQSGAQLLLRGITFQNGTTALSGGALQAATSAASITIENCEFNDNAATANDSIGGGVNLGSDSGPIWVTSCAFRRNACNGNVGGLYVGTVTGGIHLTRSLFQQNQVVNSGGYDYYGDGGGAMLYGHATCHITVRHNTFESNTASGGSNPDGGGIMTYQMGAACEVTMEDNTFTNNQAGLGGGGCIVRINNSGSAAFHRNSFSGNSTLVGSGAGSLIYIDSGTLNCTENSYGNNHSAEDGGGASLTLLVGTAVISGNNYRANEAANNGGGLMVMTESASTSFTRNTFSVNTAGNVGGGLSYATTNGTLLCTNNTHYANSASTDGGGMYLYFDQSTAQTTLKNNILWHDQPNELNYSYGSGAGPLAMTYSDAEGGSAEPWFGTGCIAVDPRFANPAAGDFNLSWPNYPIADAGKSPCIDSGDPASPRDPDGTRVDMGARYFRQANPADLDPSSIMMLLLL